MVEGFSKLGEHGAVWYAVGLAGAAVDGPRREEWLRGVRRVALSYVVNQMIKVIVRRERPANQRAHTMSNLSFPSAHTTTSFCGARMYARLGLGRAGPYSLAFAIAGIAAGVRFRNALKSTGDALFILLAIGIGLSAGIGAVELAIVMSIAFNYVFLILWITDYGARDGTRRYLRKDDSGAAGDDGAPEEGAG